MTVLYYSHPAFRLHDTGLWHPERPGRLDAVERGARLSGLPLERRRPAPVDRELLDKVHDPVYVAAVERFCLAGGGALDEDTVVTRSSWEAALLAAGAGPGAVDELRSADPDTFAFLAVRPPGHHALRNRAMGFCLFNNVAVTARALLDGGASVAVVDWDVHHGNGTQALLDGDGRSLYVSIHQAGFYPFTGDVSETGSVPGSLVNIPVPAGTGGDAYAVLFREVVAPLLRRFRPDWLLVSAGFDAHEEDPLAQLRLISADYGAMAAVLASIVPANRTVVFLEGGYHLPALAASVAATLQGFTGVVDDMAETRRSPAVSWEAVEAIERELAGRGLL